MGDKKVDLNASLASKAVTDSNSSTANGFEQKSQYERLQARLRESKVQIAKSPTDSNSAYAKLMKRIGKPLPDSCSNTKAKLASEGASTTYDSVIERLKSEIFEIEKRTDLATDEKVSRITHITCATCAGVAVQPIPFADIFILTPIQGYMGSRIAAIRGIPVSESEATTIIKEILGVIGMGFMAQQIALGIWKTLIPGAGGFMTIPIVYGLTYAIMRVMDAYLEAKAANRKLTPEEIKNIWRNAKADGDRHGKAHEASSKE